MVPDLRLSEFFYGKNWLCWDVGPALFSIITLFSLPEICEKYGLRCWGSSRFEGDD